MSLFDDAAAVSDAYKIWIADAGLHPETLLSELKYPANILLDRVSIKELAAVIELAQCYESLCD